MSIEEDIKRMEQITAKLKDNTTPLEEAIALFEEGIGIAKSVENRLTQMERKVEMLVTPPEDRSSPLPTLENFSEPEDR